MYLASNGVNVLPGHRYAPGDLNILFNRARLNQKLGNLKKAMDDYEVILKVSTIHVHVHMYLCVCVRAHACVRTHCFCVCACLCAHVCVLVYTLTSCSGFFVCTVT